MWKGSNPSHIGTRRGQHRKLRASFLIPSRVRRVLGIVTLLIVAVFVCYVKIVIDTVHAAHKSPTSLDAALKRHPLREVDKQQKPGSNSHLQLIECFSKNNRTNNLYRHWRSLVVDLAALPAADIVSILQTHDPFGVRTFEKRLLEAESHRGAFLTPEQLFDLFPCPKQRITLPDQRDHTMEQAFRDPKNRTYLYFQHLRKAGGTNFCALAKDNLPRSAVARYFCMPDYDWRNKRCAGCLDRFNNSEIDQNMHAKGHRIIGNEWDSFDASRYFSLDAIFATSFRKPLDRALSQFRFECIEERGCKLKKVEDFWAKRLDLTNVYVWTFARTGVRKISISNTKEAASARQVIMGKALDVVARFNLVLVMEWLAYASKEVESVLGFHNTSALTRRVRPHNTEEKRNDGQEKNVLGAAGITKASWDPKEYLSPEQYKIMSEDLALDEILTDAARRMFLERLVCKDV